MDEPHAYCQFDGCFVQMFCAQCTACAKVLCAEHIPVPAHRCGTSPATSSASAAEPQRSFRRTRSRDAHAALDHPLLHGHGDELTSPDLLKRPSSSDLLRRGSSLASGLLNTPSLSRGATGSSGLGLSLTRSGGESGGSLPGGFMNRGLSLFGSGLGLGLGPEIPEYLRGSGSGSGSGAGSLSRLADEDGHHGVHGHGPSAHMIPVPTHKFTRSKSRELAALGHQPVHTQDIYAYQQDHAHPASASSAYSAPRHTRQSSMLSSPDLLLHGQAGGLQAIASPSPGPLPPPHHLSLSHLAPPGGSPSSRALANVRNQFARPSSGDAPESPTGSLSARKASLRQSSRERSGGSVAAAAAAVAAAEQGAQAHAQAQAELQYAQNFQQQVAAQQQLQQQQQQHMQVQPPAPASNATKKRKLAASTAHQQQQQQQQHQRRPTRDLDLQNAGSALSTGSAMLTFEHARMEKVLTLLRSAPQTVSGPNPALVGASAADLAAAIDSEAKVDELFSAYSALNATWREHHQEEHHEAEREKRAQALVALSLNAGERHLADNAAAAHAAQTGTAWGAQSVQGGSRQHSPAMTSRSLSMVAPSSTHLVLTAHPLAHTATNVVGTLADALHLNALEVAAWSVYLDRIEPEWMARLAESGREAAIVVRLLHYSAYMVKSSFSSSSVDAHAFLPYLVSLYSDFAFAFSSWLHERPQLNLALPPAILNHRFNLIETFQPSA